MKRTICLACIALPVLVACSGGQTETSSNGSQDLANADGGHGPDQADDKGGGHDDGGVEPGDRDDRDGGHDLAEDAEVEHEAGHEQDGEVEDHDQAEHEDGGDHDVEHHDGGHGGPH
jgi:hypothetical protein